MNKLLGAKVPGASVSGKSTHRFWGRRLLNMFKLTIILTIQEKVQIGKDKEKAQSEKKIPTPKTEVGKTKQSGTYTMKTYRKPN